MNKVGNAPGSQFRMWLKASVAFRVSFFWQVCWVAVVSRILCKPTACLGWPPCTGLDEVGVRRRVCWVFWPSARLGGARLDGAPRITEPWSMGRAQAGREGESYNSWMERSGRIKKKLWMIHLRDKWLLKYRAVSMIHGLDCLWGGKSGGGALGRNNLRVLEI